eukprot:3721234-Rhodomonas_salina.2
MIARRVSEHMHQPGHPMIMMELEELKTHGPSCETEQLAASGKESLAASHESCMHKQVSDHRIKQTRLETACILERAQAGSAGGGGGAQGQVGPFETQKPLVEPPASTSHGHIMMIGPREQLEAVPVNCVSTTALRRLAS